MSQENVELIRGRVRREYRREDRRQAHEPEHTEGDPDAGVLPEASAYRRMPARSPSASAIACPRTMPVSSTV